MKCIFCGKNLTDVKNIIAANSKIGICNNCILECVNILENPDSKPVIINLSRNKNS